jgi:hypothetical protein
MQKTYLVVRGAPVESSLSKAVDLVAQLSSGSKLSPRGIENQLRCEEANNAPLDLSDQYPDVAVSFARYIEVYRRINTESQGGETAEKKGDGVSLVVLSNESDSFGDIHLTEAQRANRVGGLKNDTKDE